MKYETLKRWGVVLVGVGKNHDLLLGWLWWSDAVYEDAQNWPAVWRTRKEAAAAATYQRVRSASHSEHWRFRVVRISMTVKVWRG